MSARSTVKRVKKTTRDFVKAGGGGIPLGVGRGIRKDSGLGSRNRKRVAESIRALRNLSRGNHPLRQKELRGSKLVRAQILK